MRDTLLILEAHSCGLKVLGQNRGGESHLDSEVDDPLDSHKRAQLRHVPAAITGRVELQLNRTSGHSTPVSVSTPARRTSNQSTAAQPRGNQWEEELRERGGIQGGQWVEGAWRGSRGKGISVSEICWELVRPSPSPLPRTSVVPSSVVHIQIPPLSIIPSRRVCVPTRTLCLFSHARGPLACLSPRSFCRFPPHLCIYTLLPCDSAMSARPLPPCPLRLPVSANPHTLSLRPRLP